MIRVNDRTDFTQPSTPIPGAEIVDHTGDVRRFTVPNDGEFVARLSAAVSPEKRFNIAIGDPADAVEGEEPPIWYGVVQSWQPAGNRIMVTCRAARAIEEGVHTTTGTLGVPDFPLG
ncbi:hypothetical protein [Nocardia otitidiscaviarum]|uniref:hypothetical protein n=1 Tax=Nocardia otitidiscaviarum TaxID=1823 RepID=UPI0004A750C8|nr:hypothetical protein [Nocardia otitidiscaviarum]